MTCLNSNIKQILRLALVTSSLFISAIATEIAPAKSIPIPDGTLGTESSIIQNVIIDGLPSNRIDGGAIRGANVFHSFEEFSIGEGKSVYFSNPIGVDNILGRITGNSRSEILGKLGVLGNANLFFINPNGIIFGPNATLDVKGSFVTSTANSINFTDNTEFKAEPTQILLVLTMSTPIGLQFGATANSIRHQSQRGLQTLPEETLALIGGNVELVGGSLVAQEGRIELGSVAQESLVSFSFTDRGLIFDYTGVPGFQDIQLTQTNVSAGDIRLQGRQVSLTNRSVVEASNQGGKSQGSLLVNASDFVEIIGPRSLMTTATTSESDAGNLEINTRRLRLSNLAGLSTESSAIDDSLATGSGGKLIVNATESVELRTSFILSNTQGSGNAGEINIETDRFIASEGSQISSFSFGEGRSGNINLAARNLLVQDGSEVSVSSFTNGDAGNIQIQADNASLQTQGKITATSELGRGGGNINLQNLNLLLLQANSQISTDAQGEGYGGNITIDTDLLIAQDNSSITANAFKGRGGNIRIITQGIFRSPDSTIEAKSERGIDGEVEIITPDSDPQSGLVSLPAQPVDASNLIAQGCAASGTGIAKTSEFLVTGRGGLPPTPTEALNSDAVLVDLGTSLLTQASTPTVVFTNINNSQPKLLVEAQGWVIGSNGEVILTAQAPSIAHRSWSTPVACNAQ